MSHTAPDPRPDPAAAQAAGPGRVVHSGLIGRLRRAALFKYLAVFAILFMLSMRPAQAFLPLVAAIAAMVEILIEIKNIVDNSIAKPLAKVRELQEEVWKRFDRDIFPLQKILRARGQVAQLMGQFDAIRRQIMNPRIIVAQIPTVQTFLDSVRAQRQADAAQLEGTYRQIFLPLPPRADADEKMRTVIDAYDASALVAFKEAIRIREAADAHMRALENLEREIAGAEPGSAPILAAQAEAEAAKANALMLKIMSVHLQTGAMELASAGLAQKREIENRKDAVGTLKEGAQRARQLVRPPR